MRQRRLTNRSKIAIVAPSGSISEDYLTGGVKQLERAGFRVDVMPGVRKGAVSVFSATDAVRAEDLERALMRDDIDVIWCTRGGYGAVRTLQKMDISLLRETDKVIVGFSDITAIHSVTANSGRVGVLGPMLKHLTEHGMKSEDVQNTIALLRGDQVKIESKAMLGSKEGEVCADIVGGNLSIIYSLRGTPADVETEGKILFIEDLSEYRYHIDRMIQNLKYSGKLAGLAGLVVGQMTGMKDGATPFGKDAYQIVADAVAEYDYPVFMGYPSGHAQEVNQPVLIGGKVRMKVENGCGSLTFEERE